MGEGEFTAQEGTKFNLGLGKRVTGGGGVNLMKRLILNIGVERGLRGGGDFIERWETKCRTREGGELEGGEEFIETEETKFQVLNFASSISINPFTPFP